MRIPSDLLGITVALYNSDRDDENLTAATGAASNQIRKIIKKMGQMKPKASHPAADNTNQLCPIAISEINKLESLPRPRIVENSKLWLLLFSISEQFRCEQVRDALKEIEGIDSVYDLYGERDLLVKVRTKGNTVDEINKYIVDPLGQANLLGPKISRNRGYKGAPTIINVTDEHYYLRKELRITAGEETRGIKAFVHISSIEASTQIDTCLRECSDAAINSTGTVYFTTGYAANQEILAEFYIPCGSFYQLSEVVVSLEQALVGINAKRQTFLAMSIWEVEPSNSSPTLEVSK